MRKNPYFELDDRETIKRLIRENPWAMLVSNTSAGLVASHYPILLDDDRDDLTIVTHVGRPDERVHELGRHELLVVVQGPHGYISSSWYGELVEVPTWNFIVAHLSGVPEILGEEENFAVLRRLVEHFEHRAERPRTLDGTPEDVRHAQRLSRGTVGLRLTPTRVVAKQKMSQNRPPEVVRTILDELGADGPYSSPGLAQEMRLAHGLGGESS
ncbi:MAG: FMN-binding negative transcriptional regulator [Solirubrobacterales bacterium]